MKPVEINLEKLKNIPFFSVIDDDTMAELTEIITFRKYRKGMLIFVEGEIGDAFYFVKTGLVKLSKTMEDGREQVLHFVKDGDIFAEILLFDKGPYPATAEVMKDSEIVIIRNSELENFLLDHPQATMQILIVMSKRLRQAQQQIRDLALYSTFDRLIATFLKLAREYGVKTNKGVKINLALGQQDIANMIGSSRETVARFMADLKKSKTILVEKQYITITDENKLLNWLLK
jgi:CRP/FNR family transcriptional regulator